MKFSILNNDLKVSKVLTSLVNQSNIFYSKNWFYFLKKIPNNIPFSYVVESDEGILLAVICGVIEQNYFWPLNKLTSRAIIHGGPYIKDKSEDVLEFLLLNLNKTLKTKAIYTQFRNSSDMSWARLTFEKCGFVYEPHLDLFIDLTRDKEEIIRSISRNKRRNVTKSENKGCFVRIINNRDEFITALSLIYQTYKRVGLPVQSKKYFITAFDELQESNQLVSFGAFYNNKCIGMRIELIHGDLIYDWFAGSDDNYKNLYANDVLPYYILQWGHDNGFKVFDFGGAGKPNVPYGVRDHKMKFGGALVEFGRYECINNNILFKAGQMGLQLYKKIKKH